MKRVHLFISGKVQGVFFRAGVKEKALSLELNGFVRNLSDGRVEVIAEGVNVSGLVEFCKKGVLGSRVDDVEIIEEKFINEFKDFRVLHN